ncbi:MAG: hypothetical protein ACREX9_20735 [Gammaproteobacteria bacterium]
MSIAKPMKHAIFIRNSDIKEINKLAAWQPPDVVASAMDGSGIVPRGSVPAFLGPPLSSAGA